MQLGLINTQPVRYQLHIAIWLYVFYVTDQPIKMNEILRVVTYFLSLMTLASSFSPSKLCGQTMVDTLQTCHIQLARYSYNQLYIYSCVTARFKICQPILKTASAIYNNYVKILFGLFIIQMAQVQLVWPNLKALHACLSRYLCIYVQLKQSVRLTLRSQPKAVGISELLGSEIPT